MPYIPLSQLVPRHGFATNVFGSRTATVTRMTIKTCDTPNQAGTQSDRLAELAAKSLRQAKIIPSVPRFRTDIASNRDSGGEFFVNLLMIMNPR